MTRDGGEGRLQEHVGDVGARHAGLSLLVLYGSRSRGDAVEGSDWDLGYLAQGDLDPLDLLADLVGHLGTDRIDVADLGRAGAQLRYRAARDGRPVYERAPGAFARFWWEAVSFWCDAQPILRAGYTQALSDLDRP